MDNLFQWLIILFVIYTIINSVFGKKKPKITDKETSMDRMGEVESNTSPRPQYSSGDILQDLFGFKIPKTGDEYETYPPKDYPSDLEADLSDVYAQSKIEKEELPDIDYDKLASLEVQQIPPTTAEYHLAYEEVVLQNQRMADLKEKMKNRKTLRELFLISEILNKPKALRK